MDERRRAQGLCPVADTQAIALGQVGYSLRVRPRGSPLRAIECGPAAFSVVMAGGGVKGGTVYGATDEFGSAAVKDKVHPHDLHATILHQFGLNHDQLAVVHQGLSEKLVGVGAPARVVTEILS